MAIDPKICLFTYNFPHKKTQDFIYRLHTDGYSIRLILAADPVKLNIPPATVRTRIRHQGLLHPKKIAERFNIPYHVVKHNSPQVLTLIRETGVSLGIIAGARILRPFVIAAFTDGIINFHPGFLPEARGLDAMLWSVYNDIPLGVTAHLIDESIDAGHILQKEEILLYEDDTVFDLSERLLEKQYDMLDRSIRLAVTAGNREKVWNSGTHNGKMSAGLESLTLEKLPQYLVKQLSTHRETTLSQ